MGGFCFKCFVLMNYHEAKDFAVSLFNDPATSGLTLISKGLNFRCSIGILLKQVLVTFISFTSRKIFSTQPDTNFSKNKLTWFSLTRTVIISINFYFSSDILIYF